MECPFCSHAKAHRHGKTSKGSQRYFCPACEQSFTETFDTLDYRRQITPEEIRQVLQAHSEGSSLRGISRISGLAYETVVSILNAASQKAQMMHNQDLKAVETESIGADEFWSFVEKKQKNCHDNELEAGDCWVGISLGQDSGLIVSARVGKHSDEFIEELVVNPEGKTACRAWNSDGWGGYQRVFTPEFDHSIAKALRQLNERSNGILRQQTRRWQRRQNKFGKVWEQTEVTVRLVVSYFNWIWQHSQLKTTAAQRAGLTSDPWSWADLATYPTLL